MPELVVLAEQLLAPVPGGTGRYTRELIDALSATAPAGWEVTAAATRRGELDRLRTLPVPNRVLTGAWELGLPWWPGGDAVHAPTPWAPPRAPRGKQLVVTVHDTVPWTHPETLTPRGAGWHRRMITRARRRAEAIVVPTQAVAAELSELVPGSTPLHVTGAGVPDALLRGPVEPMSGLPAKYLLFVGTLEPRKGLDVLLAALAGLGLPLVVVGSQGWGGVSLPELARHHHVQDRVQHLGGIDDARLAGVLRGAAALVMPSRAEGFGLPVLEAMALGTPVVHSDAPALVEVAGGAGIVARRDDPAALRVAIREALERRSELVAAGLARAEQYSWRHCARAVWAVHENLWQEAH
ncbi:glycosyltransferase family 1 protein [Pseudonocardiaceae bacterium YIM PH 21723]|nr:glycosyltransferase family 1 protein [Pseudonocardiaceae bacterium YIM PH 21723]